MDNDLLGADAKVIAELVRKCDTSKRGNLYMQVSNELRLNSQHYTATLFAVMAESYGINNDG
jgi:hypothetical protein